MLKQRVICFLKKIKFFLLAQYHFVVGLVYTQKKFEEYKKNFLLIDGCEDISLEHQFKVGYLYYLNRPINEYYEELYSLILHKVEEKTPFTIIRVSDGEYFFLKGKLVGNGPTRHFTKGNSLRNVNLDTFKNGLLSVDSIHVEMYKKYKKHFYSIYNKDIFSTIPFECIYALIATKRIFKNNLRIGIIGADNKIEIIKKLLLHKQYREYLGRESFEDYIAVPERGSSNNVEELTKKIQSQLRPDIDIYLVGIGIAKLAVLSKLKEKSNAVFIDVGAGISALAGLVGHERPYFYDWINYRLKNFDYTQVDNMDSSENNDKTIYL